MELGVSALQRPLFCLALILLMYKLLLLLVLHSSGWWITQSLDVSLGGHGGDLGARRKTIVIALLSLRSVLEVESSNAYCNFVIILLPKLRLIGLVFQNE